MGPRAFAAVFLFALAYAWPVAPAVAAPPTAPAAAPGAPVGFMYFEQTGHNIGLKIKRFYDAYGSTAIFGMPLTEVLNEEGMQIQYFERARFELRPDVAGGISLTLLGQQLAEGRGEPEFQWLSTDPQNGRTYYPESGHTLGGSFKSFWERNNGMLVFGYPVSEELLEPDQNGVPQLVQYFQRARFELHPEHSGTPNEVQLSLIGRQMLERRPDAQALLAPATPMQMLGSSTTVFRTSAAERGFNIARATQMFDGIVIQPGQEYSFLSAGDFSETAGFVEGYGIVGGRLEKVVGGGLCQVSTTMFRAVSNAGLEITRRSGHTYVVYFYENILGFDATVFSPSLDFRWRNDMSTPVTFAAVTNPGEATVTFEVWGYSDGRTVSYAGPFVRNQVQPGKPIWQYNPKLPAGAKQQLVHGRPGMDVSYVRTVTMADGRVIKNNYATHYRPWNDFYSYGPGVQPPSGVTIVSASR